MSYGMNPGHTGTLGTGPSYRITVYALATGLVTQTPFGILVDALLDPGCSGQ